MYSHKLAILTHLPSNELSSYWLALTNGGLEQSMGGDQTCKSTKVKFGILGIGYHAGLKVGKKRL